MPGDGERSDEELARTATAPGSTSAAKESPSLGDTLGRARMFFSLHSAVAHYEQLQSKQIAVNH
jgi:hypothetical protein